MIEILIVWSAAVTLYCIWLTLYLRRKDRGYRIIFNTILEVTNAQRDINDSQFSINNTLATNLEILGVHTKLIPPSVSMGAEAFLKWHNERKEKNDG